MVAQFESSTQREEKIISPITQKYARLGDASGSMPPTPDKFYASEKSRIPLGELLEKTKEELEDLGISEDEIISLLIGDTKESVLIKLPERQDADLEQVLDWSSSYWNELNMRLSRRMERNSFKQDLTTNIYADARLRALGVVTFISNLENYADPETIEKATRVMTMANDLFLMGEFILVANKQDVEVNLHSYSLNSMVSTALVEPYLFDKAVNLVTTNVPESFNQIKYNTESYILGVKSELLAAHMMAELEVGDENTVISIVKPYAIRDAKESIDFVVSVREGSDDLDKEFCIVDVKKSGTTQKHGSCTVLPDGEVFQGYAQAPYFEDIYRIERTFLETVKKKDVAGLVIRTPNELVTNLTAVEISELDKSIFPEYNHAKDQILNELTFIYTRRKSNG